MSLTLSSCYSQRHWSSVIDKICDITWGGFRFDSYSEVFIYNFVYFKYFFDYQVTNSILMSGKISTTFVIEFQYIKHLYFFPMIHPLPQSNVCFKIFIKICEYIFVYALDTCRPWRTYQYLTWYVISGRVRVSQSIFDLLLLCLIWFNFF